MKNQNYTLFPELEEIENKNENSENFTKISQNTKDGIEEVLQFELFENNENNFAEKNQENNIKNQDSKNKIKDKNFEKKVERVLDRIFENKENKENKEKVNEKIRKNSKKVNDILNFKNRKTIKIGNLDYIMNFAEISLEHNIFTLRIRPITNKNFSIFKIKYNSIKLSEYTDSTGEVRKKLEPLRVARITKTDNHNGGPVFKNPYGDYGKDDVYSFNFFRRFFRGNEANSILQKEIEKYIYEYLLLKN